MSIVSAGYSWVPLLGFLASLVHFGISSWLFLNFPKVGKVFAILTATILCIWPITALWSIASQAEPFEILIYSIPVILSGLVIYNHVKTFKENLKPKKLVRIILSIIPLGISIACTIHIFRVVE